MRTDFRDIQQLAYRLWQERGGPSGDADTDWYEAEHRLASSTDMNSRIDEASRESFPASDPPASHSPDVPPANTEAKWRASRRAKRAHSTTR